MDIKKKRTAGEESNRSGVSPGVADPNVSGASVAQDTAKLYAFCVQIAEENGRLKRRMDIMWDKIWELVYSKNINRVTRMTWAERAAPIDELPSMEVMEHYDEEDGNREYQD